MAHSLFHLGHPRWITDAGITLYVASTYLAPVVMLVQSFWIDTDGSLSQTLQWWIVNSFAVAYYVIFLCVSTKKHSSWYYFRESWIRSRPSQRIDHNIFHLCVRNSYVNVLWYIWKTSSFPKILGRISICHPLKTQTFGHRTYRKTCLWLPKWPVSSPGIRGRRSTTEAWDI